MAAANYETVLEETIAIVRKHVAEGEVVEGSRFTTDLALDSVGTMDLVADIEDHFNVTIPLNELPELQTVADTARRLVLLLEEQAERTAR